MVISQVKKICFLSITLAVLCLINVNSLQAEEVIIDNGNSGTSYTGTWQVSGATGAYGANSLYGRSGATYTWHANLPKSGAYEVYMWWTQYSSRSTSVPITITYSGGSKALNVNQQINGGKWNLLGKYAFDAAAGGTVKLSAPNPSPTSYCADAVKFVYLPEANVPPIAKIDSISPNPADLGQEVTLTGHGTDIDGTVTGYNWRSNIGGQLSTEATFNASTLSEGTHTIYLKVQDDKGDWSAEVSQNLIVGEVPIELILDNGSSGTSSTGTWQVSGATGAYGANSLYGRSGATYTWHATLPKSGLYEVYMWWTQYSSRSTSVPITITYSGDSQALNVNQQINGGKWNLLGKYYFDTTTGGTVKLSAPNSSPTSYCADAVKFVYLPGVNATPTAKIDSISPNPVDPGQPVNFVGHGTDADGTIVAYSWRSSIDLVLSEQVSFNTSALSTGKHTIYFKVQDNKGDWSAEVSQSLDVGQPITEHIYACFGYSPYSMQNPVDSVLKFMGATKQGGNWVYQNTTLNKTFIIHFVTSISGMIQALKTEGAHIIYEGHSNYGLGAIFASTAELENQKITNIRYIDDDRIFNYSSKWIHVSLSGLRTSQAFPYWWPIFKDGTSGIMPFDFSDPNNPPPYNYYLTYQVPGDSTYYKVETVRNSAVQRFSDSRIPAWYAADGSKPDPTDPGHLQYFITNTAEWYPSVEMIGSWQESYALSGYFKENYRLTAAGTGDKQFKWIFRTPATGNYKVYAYWPASATNAADAPYTINYAGGSKEIRVDQRINGNTWNELGEFYFDVGEYNVVLNNNVSSGNVIADAVRVVHVDNPPAVIQSDFLADVTSGSAPLAVQLDMQATGDVTNWEWDFGDGAQNTTRDSILHTYSSPGTYTVSLTVSGPAGSSRKIKTGYITVGSVEPVLKAEFSASPRSGLLPLTVNFKDWSCGNNIVSWLWDFGDGQTSAEQNPVHTYETMGNLLVALTVTDADGNSSTETKANFVSAAIFDKSIDNVDYPKTHYRRKNIIFRKDPEINEQDLKYSRMLYMGCNSGNYFIDTFHRGIMFYTLNSVAQDPIKLYLPAYLEGKSDNEIWQILQDYSPVFDYYDFTKRPDEQQ